MALAQTAVSNGEDAQNISKAAGTKVVPKYRSHRLTYKILKEIGWLIVFYLSWSAMFFPAAFKMGHGFLGGVRSDPAAYIYYVIHNISHVLSFPTSGFDANYFFPFGKSLAYSDNFILPALIAKPVYWLTGRYAPAYNFAMITAAALNGYLTFCLSRFITRNSLYAYVAGFAFMSLPFLYGHLGHPQLQFAFFIPGVVLASLYFVQKRTLLSASLVGACVFLQFLATAYYAMIAYLLSALVLSCYGLLRFRSLKLRDFSVLFFANLPWAVGLYFVTKPYLAVRDVFGPMHPSLVKHFSATFSSYIAMSPNHLIWGFLAGPFARNGSYLSVGLTILLLSSFGFLTLISVKRFCNDSTQIYSSARKFLSLTIFVCILFLFGAHIFFGESIADNDVLRSHILSAGFWPILLVLLLLMFFRGDRVSSEQKALVATDYGYIISFLCIFFLYASFGIVGSYGSETINLDLYYILYKYLPGYNSMRAVYRFGVISGLMAILMATLSLKHFLDRGKLNNTKLRCFVVIPIFLLVALELKTRNYEPSRSGRRPGIYKHLDSIPGKEAVISLPFHSPIKHGLGYSRAHTAYMLWTLPTGRPMMSGWSSKLPRFYQFKGEVLDEFPAQSSLNALGQIVGLRYLIYHGDGYSDFDSKKFEDDIRDLDDQLEVVEVSERRADYLFRLDPQVNLLSLEYPELYLKPAVGEPRTLSFDVKLMTDNQQLPISIPVKTGYEFKDNMKEEVWDSIELIPSENWQRVSLSLPASTHPVIPHKVVFQIPEDSNINSFKLKGIEASFVNQ